MERLSLSQMESLSGGKAKNFVDGFCAGATGAGVLATVLGIASNVHPVAKGIAVGIGVGCAVWGLHRLP